MLCNSENKLQQYFNKLNTCIQKRQIGSKQNQENILQCSEIVPCEMNFVGSYKQDLESH